jgi:hypothetical protein
MKLNDTQGGVAMLTGIGMVADVPSLRLATSESVSAD